MRKNRLIIPALLAFLSLQGYAQELNDSITSGKPAKYSDEVVEIGYHKAQRPKNLPHQFLPYIMKISISVVLKI